MRSAAQILGLAIGSWAAMAALAAVTGCERERAAGSSAAFQPSAGAATPLHLAAEEGRTEEVGGLLARGSDVNAPGEYGWTPLHYAARGDSPAIIDLLLAAGANVEARDADGETTLQHAAFLGKTQAVELLLDRGAGGEGDMDRALIRAAFGGSGDAANALLLRGADPNTTGPAGETPLFDAVRGGETGIVRSLLAAGARVDVRAEDGTTPLHEAAFCLHRGRDELVRLLLEEGTDPRVQDGSGRTPLHDAASEAYATTAALLLAYGADPSAADDHGRTPLHCAAYYGGGSPRTVGLLLAHKADVKAKTTVAYEGSLYDAAGMTPLHMAVESGSLRVVRLLVAANADVNIRDAGGNTPLGLAGTHESPQKPSRISTFLRQHGGKH